MFKRCLPLLFALVPLGPACLPAATAAAANDSSYLLGPNDKITVRCVNADEFPETPIRIDSDGHVTLPFVGRIKLAGLTVSEAEKQISIELAKYVVDPQVELNVAETHSQPVSVFGAVNNPGAYQLEGKKTLTEIISMAGGLKKEAGQTLKVTRRVDEGPIPLASSEKDQTGQFYVGTIDIESFIRGNSPTANIEIRPYDVITIPEADIVYVVGQVRKPGGFTVTGDGGMTILQALSLAEGLDKAASPKKARILRRSGDTNRTEIAVNLDKILAGTSPDVTLHPNDVLFVPNSLAKSTGQKTLDAMVQLTTGIIIYGRY